MRVLPATALATQATSTLHTPSCATHAARLHNTSEATGSTQPVLAPLPPPLYGKPTISTSPRDGSPTEPKLTRGGLLRPPHRAESVTAPDLQTCTRRAVTSLHPDRPDTRHSPHRAPPAPPPSAPHLVVRRHLATGHVGPRCPCRLRTNFPRHAPSLCAHARPSPGIHRRSRRAR
jgi:hypothetical protein